MRDRSNPTDETVRDRLDESVETEGNGGDELPKDVVEDAQRLTKLARRAVDDSEAEAYRADRDDQLDAYDYRARVREEETREVLVLYPEEWMEDGTVQLDRVEDTDRAVERTLSGTGDATEYEQVDAHNREVVEEVREGAGDVHAANAASFADYMGNYYVRRVGSATDEEVREFLEEYYPRNAFASDDQKDVVEESIRLVFEVEDRDPPPVVE